MRPTTLSIGKWNRKHRNRILCTSFSTIFRFPNVLSIYKEANCEICICISSLFDHIKNETFSLLISKYIFFDLCIANLCFVWWYRVRFMQISIGSFLFFLANIYLSTRFLLRIGEKRNELQCHRAIRVHKQYFIFAFKTVVLSTCLFDSAQQSNHGNKSTKQELTDIDSTDFERLANKFQSKQ